MEPIFDLALDLPPRGARTLLRALHQQLRAAIVDGRLRAGLRLPATRALATHLGVSRNTVIAAYDLLLAEGYVEGRTGAGTFVADLRPAHPAAPPADTAADARLAAPWRGVRPPTPVAATPFRFDFLSGFPDTAAFPFDVWRRLTARAARQLSRRRVAEGDPAGEASLRDAISRHVSFARAVACVADDIVVTAGARQAVDLLARILVTPGETEVALEDPGYPPVRHAFQAAGARIVAVPVDEEGLVVERLPPGAHIICVTPSHQFPLGVVLSARRRAALLDFARTTSAVVIEDDYDSELRHEGRPLDALQTLDRSGSVFYVGTFSKSLFPALRLGFVAAPPWARDALVAARQLTDWHGPVIAQATLADFIDDGHLARHIRRMRRIYAERHAALERALTGHLGHRLRPLRSVAGVHLAATLTAPGDATALVAAAAARGIRLEDIARYAARADAPPGLVLGYGLIEADAIDPAIRELATLPW